MQHNNKQDQSNPHGNTKYKLNMSPIINVTPKRFSLIRSFVPSEAHIPANIKYSVFKCKLYSLRICISKHLQNSFFNLRKYLFVSVYPLYGLDSPIMTVNLSCCVEIFSAITNLDNANLRRIKFHKNSDKSVVLTFVSLIFLFFKIDILNNVKNVSVVSLCMYSSFEKFSLNLANDPTFCKLVTILLNKLIHSIVYIQRFPPCVKSTGV